MLDSAVRNLGSPAPNSARHWTALFWPVPLTLIAALAYAFGLGIKYYGDDFGYILDPATPLVAYWTRTNLHGWYRPLQMTYMAVVQQRFGLSTYPIHVAQLLLHLLLALLVFDAARELGLTTGQAWVGSLLALLSQVNPIAVQSTDTLSTVTASLFGFATLWLLLRLAQTPPEARWIQMALGALSVGTFSLSLFSKESSVGLLLMTAVVLFAVRPRPVRLGLRVSWPTVVIFLPYLAMFSLYYALRARSGSLAPSFGPGDYQFSLSPWILGRNLAELLLAAVTPVSTAATYVALVGSSWLLKALVVAAPALVAAVALYGLWGSEGRPTWFLLGVLGLLSVFPAVFLNHVSELYDYNALPFLSLLLAAGWTLAIERTGSRKVISRTLQVLLALTLAGNVASLELKTALMVQNGERADRILQQLGQVSSRVPAGGTLLLINPSASTPSYSVFLINGFDLIKGARQEVERVSGRSDFSVKILEPGQPMGTGKASEVKVTLSGDRVVTYPGP